MAPSRNRPNCHRPVSALGTHLGTQSPFELPVRLLIRRDGTRYGEGISYGDDPLQATLIAARPSDHVSSIELRRAGWWPSVPCVEAVAHFDDAVERELDVRVQEVRQEIVDELRTKVIRLLFHAGLSATSLMTKVGEDGLKEQLGEYRRQPR